VLAGSRAERLEQFDRVAGRVVHDDLSAADAVDDVAAEPCSACAQVGHRLPKVLHLQRESVPSAGLWPPTVRKYLSTAALATWRAEHEPQVTAAEHRERGRRMHHLLESEQI